MDSDDRNSVDILVKKLDLLLMNSKIRDIPFLVFAHKQDATNSMSAVEVSSKLENILQNRDFFVQPSATIEKPSAAFGDEYVITDFQGMFQGLKWLHENV